MKRGLSSLVFSLSLLLPGFVNSDTIKEEVMKYVSEGSIIGKYRISNTTLYKKMNAIGEKSQFTQSSEYLLPNGIEIKAIYQLLKTEGNNEVGYKFTHSVWPIIYEIYFGGEQIELWIDNKPDGLNDNEIRMILKSNIKIIPKEDKPK